MGLVLCQILIIRIILFMADEIDEDAGWPSEEINVAVTSQVELILGEA